MRRIPCLLVLLLAAAGGAASAGEAVGPKPGYLVVASEASRPALEPLLERRREHCEVSVLTVEELTQGGGALTPAALKQAIRARCTDQSAIAYLLLVGDTKAGSDGLHAIPTHPQGFDPWYGVLATDDTQARPPARHQPAIAVGRLPASTARELMVMVGKTIAYETRSRPGPWQRRIHVVAGTANFGPVADALVDRAAMAVLDGAIPMAYSLSVTRGLTSSPYGYPPDEFEGRVVELFSEGALLVIYLGHGKARSAYAVKGFASGKMMDCGTMRRLRCRAERRPIAVFLACSMGWFDGRRDCLAEAALKSPGGPVACVASFRRNHVYGNAVFGLELARALFDPSEPTLGGCVRRAQRRLVSPQGAPDPIRLALNALALADPKARVPRAKHPGLLVEHVYLYGLLGDPALRLARPAPSVERLTATLGANQRHWLVEGAVPTLKQGSCLVTLESPRAVIRGRLEPVSPQDPRWRDAMRRNYATANRKVLAEARCELADGRFRCLLPTAPARQPLAPGLYTVKIVASSTRETAIGATQVAWPPKAQD